VKPEANDGEIGWGDPAEITASIRRGSADVAAGRVTPADEVFARLFAQLGVDPEQLPPDEAANQQDV
jgi:hypothetical protein